MILVMAWIPSACTSTQTKPAAVPTTQPTASTGHKALEPPDALTPTAGSCSRATGPVGNVTIASDMVPQPRCLLATHDQRLSVTNKTGAVLQAQLGALHAATIPDGATHTFPDPLGSFFAPGVHHLTFTELSHADIWLDAACDSNDANCSTPPS